MASTIPYGGDVDVVDGGSEGIVILSQLTDVRP